jgi:large subunit ribosomal protein L24
MAKPKYKIKSDDLVKVIAGGNKGATGRVTQILTSKRRVLVEGVNLVTRYHKKQGDNPGQAVEKEASLDISNVCLWDEENERPIKVGWGHLEDGTKVRIDKRTGQPIE